jgi:hypothetical protein
LNLNMSSGIDLVVSRGVLLGGLAEFLVPAREIEAREKRARLETGVAALDRLLGGGWPRGALSELCGGRGQGRTGVLLASLAAALRREETVALLDLEGAFDPWTARRAGVRLERLLWVRARPPEGGGRAGPVAVGISSGQRQASSAQQKLLAAAEAIVAAGGFGLVALDLGDDPRTVPSAAWLRLRRVAGAPGTAVLVVTGRPLMGSMGAAAVALEAARPRFQQANTDASTNVNDDAGWNLLTAVETRARLVRQTGSHGNDDDDDDANANANARPRRHVRGPAETPTLTLLHAL